MSASRHYVAHKEVNTVYACSSNPGKLREFGLVTAELAINFEVVQLPGLKAITPPEETGETFEANAAGKATYYSRFTDNLILADDSGLEVDALNGEPGIYSARYATPHLENRQLQDEANNRLLLQRMDNHDNRTARFVSVIALARGGTVLHVTRGTVEGKLLRAASGAGGFGYDPLFFYPPFNCSFAELDEERKFTASARGNAMRQALTWLKTYPGF